MARDKEICIDVRIDLISECYPFSIFHSAGIVDPAPRPAHPDRGPVHVHGGPAAQVALQPVAGRVGAGDQAGAQEGLGPVRVPDQHAARQELLCGAARCR